MPPEIKKRAKEPYEIRDYRLLLSLLKSHKLDGTKEGQRMLALVKKPADRAQARLDKKKAQDPDKGDWDKAYDKCWSAFSVLVRTMGTISFGESRRGPCVTCKKVFDFKDLQAGHWIPTANWGTKFHLFNVHSQCWQCNSKMRGNGKMPEHEQYIREVHGAQVPEMLKRLKLTHGRKLTTKELEVKTSEFKSQTETFLGRERVGEI